MQGAHDELVIEMLEALDCVQSARLLSMQAFNGDPFEECSKLFTLEVRESNRTE